MNTRDLAQQKAYELLRDLRIDETSEVYRPDGESTTALAIATTAFLRGWVHGLQDSAEIRRKTLASPKTGYVSLLQRQAE